MVDDLVVRDDWSIVEIEFSDVAVAMEVVVDLFEKEKWALNYFWIDPRDFFFSFTMLYDNFQDHNYNLIKYKDTICRKINSNQNKQNNHINHTQLFPFSLPSGA